MRQRNLYGIVLLLAGALVALPGQVPGQTAGTPAPSAAWATAGNDVVAEPASAPAVIASTRPHKPTLSPDSRLPPIDDGLKPLIAPPATPTARVPPAPPGPLMLKDEGVQHALYTTPAETSSSKVDPNVVPTAAAIPAEAPRLARVGSMLALEMVGPRSAAPGQTVSCTVIARNVGSMVLAGVQVEVPLPESVLPLASEPLAERRGNGLFWNLGNLEAGAERRLKIDVATSDPGELHLCPTAQFGVAVGLRTAIVRPPFALTVKGPTTATVGGSIVWKIQVANHTTTPLRRVTLTCKLSEGLSHGQGDTIETEAPQGLAPGQAYSIDLNVTALRPGRQVISLSASAEGGLAAQAQGVVLVNELMLALSPQGPRHGRVGEELAFQLELNNPGGNSSGPIRLTQVLPIGLEFTSASKGGVYNAATQTITWMLDSLASAQRHVETYQARATKVGDWALGSAVQVEGMADLRATHAVHVSAPPALTLEVTAHENALAMGAETTYEVRVYNQGSNSAEGVRLRMVAPDTLLAVQATAPCRWQIQGQQILFDPLDEMRPRNAAVYRLRLRGARIGAGRFRVELMADGLSQPIQQELTCRVQEATVLPLPGTSQARR